jgi:hypothetical protein
MTKISYLRDLKMMGIITAEHQPTKEMVSDLLTKTLQGTLFTKHRDTLQGLHWSDKFK